MKTKEKTIKSEYLKYDKEKGFLIFKKDIIATDKEEILLRLIMLNIMKKNKYFLSKGLTEITTSQNYKLVGSNIIR